MIEKISWLIELNLRTEYPEIEKVKDNENWITVMLLPINDRKCRFVRLGLRAATPIHVWFPIHNYQI